MENFLDQLPAILGVLVGALGTLLVTSLTDKARWRRDQAVRWDTRRLDAYVAYAAAVKESHTLALRISAPYRRYSKSHAIDREQGLVLLAEANVTRTKAWEAVLLLGNEAAVTATRVWKDAVDAEERLCGDESSDEMEWQSAVEAVDQARDGFYLSAREDLGVHGGSVAQYPFLRYRVRTRLSRLCRRVFPGQAKTASRLASEPGSGSVISGIIAGNPGPAGDFLMPRPVAFALVSPQRGREGTLTGAGETFAIGWPCAGRSVVTNRGRLPAGAVSLAAAWVVRREAAGVRPGDFAMHGAARYARMTAW